MTAVRGLRAAVATLGGCVLLPYNCLLLAQPYFADQVFAGWKFAFTSMLVYSVTLCSTQVLLTFKGELLTVNGRMWTSFLGTLVVCLALLAITVVAYWYQGKYARNFKICDQMLCTALYAACLVAISALGVLNSVMQTTLLGLAGSMSQEVSAAAMLGFGVSGLLSFGFSLVVQLVNWIAGLNEATGTSGFAQTVAAFAFSTLYTFASLWVYHVYLCRRVPQAVSAIAVLERRRSSRSPSSQSLGTEQGFPALESSIEGSPKRNESGALLRRTTSTIQEVAPQAFNVWLVFAVTMCIFPGVVTEWQPRPGSIFVGYSQWFGTLSIGCFQVFDVFGRILAGRAGQKMSPRRLWIWVVLRLVFVPLFVLGQRWPDACWLWGSDPGRVLLVAALSGTNGFLASCAMMFGPIRSADERREVAGIVMSCTMVCGIFAGTLLALLTQIGA